MDKNLLEVANEITAVRDELSKAPISSRTADYLSSAAVRLSLLRMMLGSHLADIDAETENAENTSYFTYRKVDEKDMDSKNMLAAEDAKRMARKDNAEKRKQLLALQIHHRDLGDLITSLQSRCKVLGDERRESNFQKGNL